MKKLFMIITSMALAAGGLTTVADTQVSSFGASDIILLGDVDKDNKITLRDAQKVLRFSVRIENPTPEQKIYVDVNGDGHIDLRDATISLRIAVGIEAEQIIEIVVTAEPTVTPETESPTTEPSTEPTQEATVTPTSLPDSSQDPTASEQPEQVPFHDINVYPGSYKKTNATQQGKVVEIEYETSGCMKTALAYLPYGYDERDTDTRYNVMYLMHGGGNNVTTFLGGANSTSILKRILDHMIQNGELDPLIVVTPTFYGGPSNNEFSNVKTFPSEFENDLMPAVESTLHTYAKTADAQGFEESREHRAFGGFSMGSATTWNMFIDDLKYVKYFMPMSGDCWAVAQTGGDAYAEQTVQYLINAIEKQGYTKDDFYIYAMTGSNDIAYNYMKSQIDAAQNHPEMFIFSRDLSKGNICFGVLSGGQHALDHCYRYIYHALPSFWTESK